MIVAARARLIAWACASAWALACAVAIVACASPRPAKTAAGAAHGAASSSPTPAAIAPSHRRCLASFAATRPASGWIETGKLLVSTRKGHAFAVEVRDARGHVVEFVRLMREHEVLTVACKIDGVLLVLDGAPANDGVHSVTVLRPAREDERGDVALLCNKPAIPSAPDDAALWRATLDAFAERLTSTRWRTWLFDLDASIFGRRGDDDEPLRKADELEAAAKSAGIAACWTSTELRREDEVSGDLGAPYAPPSASDAGAGL